MRNNKGYMVLEALIAIAIFGMLVVAIFPSINFLIGRTRQTKEDSQAAVLLQEGMEGTYNILTQTSDPDLSGFAAGYYELVEGTQWSLLASPSQTLDIYERTIELQEICRDGAGEQKACPGGEDLYSKKVITTVCWMGCPPDKTRQAEMVVVKI